MTVRNGGVFLLAVVTIACAALSGGAKGAKTTSVNVTTIVHDTDSTGAALLLKSDDFNGSFQATYSTGVASVLSPDGRFFLELFGQTTRTLFITPNSPINGSQPTAA